MALIRSKVAFKKFAGRCAFCNETDYAVLDIHRIFEGYKGGVYDSINCICVCANHHRKIHDNQINIIRKHLSFGENQYVLEYIEGQDTKYLPMNY